MSSETISSNLVRVKARIQAACERAGRDLSEVRLLPVSKTHPSGVLRDAVAAGVREFGENRVQEIDTKRAEMSDLDLHWALIGPLQSNKCRLAAEIADEFQALERLKVARMLNRRLDELDKDLDVLIEVNTSGEESKHGLNPGDVLDFAQALDEFPRLCPRGLMTVAIPGPDMGKVAACFETLRDLQAKLKKNIPAHSWHELSMGMSGDFELAIEHGSTCVRVGSAIFGAREYPNRA